MAPTQGTAVETATPKRPRFGSRAMIEKVTTVTMPNGYGARKAG